MKDAEETRLRKNALQRGYRLRHHEEVLERDREYSRRKRAENREETLARERAYRARNREAINRRNRERRRELSADDYAAVRVREKRKLNAYQERNRARYLAVRKVIRERNADAIRAAYKDWYARNRIELLARKQAKYWSDVERMRLLGRVRHAQRRARIRTNGGNHTVEQWETLVKRYGGHCAYCGELREKLHADHRIPLCRGGSNAIENILPACPSCNFRKHTLTEDQFRALNNFTALSEPAVAYAA